MTPDEIEEAMDGRLRGGAAFLPATTVQNHAAFLARLPDGALVCAWFGGTLEGRSDISIHASVLEQGSDEWTLAQRLTDFDDRSEQNPVIFTDADGSCWLFNTAQPAGNQDEAQVWRRSLSRDGARLLVGEAQRTDLPAGTFIRGDLHRRDDGAWLLPLFLCNTRPGARWTGAYDTAAIGVSTDRGLHWKVSEVPQSLGAVHMTIVDLQDGGLAAFYRRRQADMVYRSESRDGGRSWSAPMPTDVPNNNSSIAARRLADGAVGLVCNPVSAQTSASRRQSLYDELGESDSRPDASGGCNPIWGVERAPVTLCISFDGGKSFPARHIVEDGPGTCLSNNSLDGRNRELSYPSLLPAPDGSLDIAYTYHRRAIRHRRISSDALNTIMRQEVSQ